MHFYSKNYLWPETGTNDLDLDLDSTRIQVDSLGHTSMPF